MKTTAIGAPPRWRRWLPALAIVLVTAAVYSPCLRYGYTFLDDNALILGRMDELRRLPSVVQAFREDVFRFARPEQRFFYRPALVVSFILDAQWGAATPAPFHATNILLHVLAALLAGRLARRLTGSGEKAFIFSLIFALHPALSQAVAWIPGRNDSLLAVLALAAQLALMDYAERPGPGSLAGHAVFLLLALLAKETAVVIPIVGGIYLHLSRSRLPRKPAASLAATWLVVVAGWFMARRHVLDNPGAWKPEESLLTLGRNLPAVLVYLDKLALPTRLSVFPIREDARYWPAAAALIAAAASFWRGGPERRPMKLFAAAWFILFLIPSLSVSDGVSSRHLMYHRVYTSFAGLAPFLPDLPRGRPARAALWALPALLAVLTWRHLPNFKDPVAFWEDAVRTSPASPFARNNMGAMYYMAGDADRAEAQWRKALELNPREPLAHGNMGLLLMNKGRWAEAEQELLEEMRINPMYDNAPYNLGLLYSRAGKEPEALSLWAKAIALNPRHGDAYARLIASLWNAGRREEAAAWARRALQDGAPLPPRMEALARSHALPSRR